MTYFIKELLSNPLRLPSGARVVFEDVGGNMGILATEDAALVAELKNAEERRVGGVYEVEKAKYDDLKKKVGLASISRENLLNVIKLQPLSPAQPEGKSESAAAFDVGQPLEVPDSIPTTKKISGKRRGRPPKKQTDNLIENLSS